jgi:hypothetical protein
MLDLSPREELALIADDRATLRTILNNPDRDGPPTDLLDELERRLRRVERRLFGSRWYELPQLDLDARIARASRGVERLEEGEADAAA